MAETPAAAESASTDDALIGENAAVTKQGDVIGFTIAGGEATVETKSQRATSALRSVVKPKDEDDHDVKTYLERWTRLDNFYFTPSFTRGDLLAGHDVMDTLRTNERFMMHRTKLRGFYGMTANVEFMLQVNANPMEAGILGMAFQPFLNNRNETDPIRYCTQVVAWKEQICTYLSQFPNIWLNIATESSVTLTVPYVGPNVYINLSNKSSDWGQVQIYCVSPLSTASNTANVDVSLYMRFTNIQLYGATVGIPGTAQGPSNEFEERGGIRDTIQNVVDVGRGVASIVSPILDTVAPEASFVISAVDNIARFFGFSKPNAAPEHNRMAITPFGQPQNVDGTSNAFKFGVTSDQNTEIHELGLSNKDEMNINYIAQQPSYLSHFTWTTAQAVNTQLKLLAVSPNIDCHTKYLGYRGYLPTALRFSAQWFNLWRGGIRYTFHVAGTKFHSGRLRFIYCVGNTAPSLTHGTLPLYYSQIVDIRDGSVFSIECPYIATLPWKEVPNEEKNEYDYLNTIAEVNDQTLLTEENTWLYVVVETALRAPESVAQEVSVAIVVSGMDDFEVACPSYDRVRSVMDPIPDNEPNLAPVRGVAQGPLIPPEAPSFSMTGSASSAANMSDMPARVCVGERIASFRSLIKRLAYTGDITVGNNSTEVITPFALTPTYFRYGTGDVVEASTTDELLRNILGAYVFYRGGLRYTFVPNSTSACNINAAYVPYCNLNNYTPSYPYIHGTPVFRLTGATRTIPRSSTIPVASSLQAGVDIQVPYYSPFPLTLTSFYHFPKSEDDFLETYMKNMENGICPRGLVFLHSPAESLECSAFRSVADDFSLGYLVGPPMAIIAKTLVERWAPKSARMAIPMPILPDVVQIPRPLSMTIGSHSLPSRNKVRIAVTTASSVFNTVRDVDSARKHFDANARSAK